VTAEATSPTVEFDGPLTTRLAGALAGAPVIPTGAGHDAGILQLAAMRRTRIGPFGLDAAQPLADLDVASALIGPADAATRLLGRLDLTEQQAIDLGHGKSIEVDPAQSRPGPIAAIAPDGRLVGLVEYRGSHAKSLINFPPDDTGDTGTTTGGGAS